MSARKGTVLVLIAALFLFATVLTTGAQDFGTNWTGVFYNNTSFQDPAVATITGVNGLNFNWPDRPVINGQVLAAVNPDNFSARFTSTQNFLQAGRYTFTVTVDDAVRILINGQERLNLPAAGLQTQRFEVDLTAGPHTFQVDFIELSAAAVLQLQWTLGAPGATAGPTPTPGPTETPAPTGLPPIPPGALSATVIRATVLLVREAPYLGAPVMGRILRGQTYAVVGRDPRALWFLLQLSDRQAWAWGYYLAINGNEFNAPVVNSFVTQGDPAASTEVTVQTQAGLRLRADATIYSEQIGRIPWGHILPVIGRTGDNSWYQVVFAGTVGWISAAYTRPLRGDLNTVPVTR